ncbi:nascent polypeptide-associated complex subunit alpha, muscle-specific form-like [Ischnura elegans]|uniref:nascent polypeptide-associated complex subunit alpha, muscle-specific form-like n=1 Tax=Ischnura elegans TaxID=197161 RepID=UPI001ED8A56F|nr:nascent polypeptide-associated complex subunit alpha, muscle-specific form-like [Ischnura elegans]
MGRRSAAGAGAAAAQVEASSAAGPKDPPGKRGEGHRRKRSMIFVKKTIVKPQSPKKDSDKQPKQKLAPSPPPMPARARQGKRKSSPRGVAPSPPRIRDGKVVSPSPMSRPRVNGHYTPPKYTSPPPGYGPGGRHPSPPPPVGIRGRPARCLSPTPSISPPPEPRGRKNRRTSYSPSPDRVNRGPRSPPRMSPTRGPRFSRGQREGRDRSPGSHSPSPSRQSTVICGMQPPFPTRPTHSPSMDDLRYGSRGGMYDDSPPMAERALEEIYASSPRIPSSPTMRGGYPGGRGGVYASPPRLPPSPPMRGRMPSRGGIYGSDTRVPSTPQARGRAGARGGVYASPPRLPQFPSERSRSRTGHRPPSPPASRMAPTSVPRSRRASPSPPARMIPHSPDMTMRASRSQQRRPQPPTTFPHIPPLPLTQHTGRSRGEISLSRHDSAIRGLSPVRIDPIPSPIYERLSPVPQSGKRGRSPSPPTPVPIPGYLASKPPLPPQALSSRRPQSPSQRRSLGPSSNKRSPSPDLKRRYSCVTVIPREANFSPHLPRPPPTAPSNFKRIAPNFAARRSRKASFVILNEKEVKRKSDSRRGSVDEGELDHEGDGVEDDGQEGDEGETGEGKKKSSKGKGGKTKAVSIVLVEDEDEPESARSKGKLSARKTKEGGLSPRPPSGGRSSPGVAGTPTPRGDKSPSPRPSPTPRDPSGQEPLLGATLGAPVNETLDAATASGSESHRESSRAPSASLIPPAGSAASRAGTPTPGGDPAAVSRAATPVPASDAAGGVPSRAPSATGIRDQKQILEAGSLGATSPSPVPTEVSGGKPAATPTDKPVSIQGVTGGEGEGYTPRSGGGSILEGSVATQGG